MLIIRRLNCIDTASGMRNDMSTAIGLTHSGGSTVHIYTQTIHRTTQITTNLEECWPCTRLCEFYPGICLTEEKARKNLSQCGVGLNWIYLA